MSISATPSVEGFTPLLIQSGARCAGVYCGMQFDLGEIAFADENMSDVGGGNLFCLGCTVEVIRVRHEAPARCAEAADELRARIAQVETPTPTGDGMQQAWDFARDERMTGELEWGAACADAGGDFIDDDLADTNYCVCDEPTGWFICTTCKRLVGLAFDVVPVHPKGPRCWRDGAWVYGGRWVGGEYVVEDVADLASQLHPMMTGPSQQVSATAAAASDFVPRGCLNMKWSLDGAVICQHSDDVACDLPDHHTVPLYARRSDLEMPAWPPQTIEAARAFIDRMTAALVPGCAPNVCGAGDCESCFPPGHFDDQDAAPRPLLVRTPLSSERDRDAAQWLLEEADSLNPELLRVIAHLLFRLGCLDEGAQVMERAGRVA